MHDAGDWSPPEGHTGRCVFACAAGPAVGLALATLWNAPLLPAMAPGLADIPRLAPLLQSLGGAILGACLGAAQAAVLRGAYRDLPFAAWVAATAAAGYLAALAIGLIYGALAQRAGSMPIEVFVLLGAALKGVLGGLLSGIAQGRVLDRVVADRASWVRVVTIPHARRAAGQPALAGPADGAGPDDAGGRRGVRRRAGRAGARHRDRRRLPLHAAARSSASAAVRFSRARAS